MSEIQQVINMIVSDEKFRSALTSNPAAALEGVGVEVTSEMLVSFARQQSDLPRDLGKIPGCC